MLNIPLDVLQRQDYEWVNKMITYNGYKNKAEKHKQEQEARKNKSANRRGMRH